MAGRTFLGTLRLAILLGVLAFVALIGIDSAAFAIIQQDVALNAHAWGTPQRRILHTWTVSPDAYVPKTRVQTIWFDRNWLTPLRQKIRTVPEPVTIEYGGRTALGPRQYLPAWLEARTSS